MLTKTSIGDNTRGMTMSIYKSQIRPHSKMIRSHLESGGSIADLAKKLKVPYSSLYRCLRSHPELAAPAEKAEPEPGNDADAAVENALFQRAVGFEQPDGKFVPPDVRAAMFWLKNRRPLEWGENRKNTELSPAELSEVEMEL